jgi:hypothetical protein
MHYYTAPVQTGMLSVSLLGLCSDVARQFVICCADDSIVILYHSVLSRESLHEM